MQKENNGLLAIEIKELGDDLVKTLYGITKDSLDVNHACLTLLDLGIINISELRNFSILRDYDISNKYSSETQMNIYYNLSAKYDLSVNHIRKVIKDTRYKG
tara:strand:- start:1283 stop:1588 length:306 start_codon:yes stop_codon:yes gene_type:complete